MNSTRIILGGILAGIILWVGATVTNDVILGSDWQAWQKTMGPLNHAPSRLVASLIWLVVMISIGIAGMWIYAAARSRLTPGPATAAKVGVAVWVCAFFAPELGNIALGSYPLNTIVVGSLAGLAGAVVSMLAGAWVYRE
jgi:heme/copper-type cytochrome/quinol oxidase subunit 2